jgi:predicted Zn-ribbon and HTH transcriptional regulator
VHLTGFRLVGMLYDVAEIVMKVAGYRCERCQHEWIARRPRNMPAGKAPKKMPKPRICPKCKSAWWDTPKAEK